MKQIECELQDFMGNDRSISDSAWTSSTLYKSNNKRTKKDVERVVKMLAELKHSVPFESVILRFWLRLPIATDRQLMTHRLQSSSGTSARYRTMPSDYLTMPNDVTAINMKIMNTTEAVLLESRYDRFCRESNEFYTSTLATFKEAEKQGKITNKEYKRIREFYRGVLPQHNMTERVTIMNLRSFANFIKLRNSEHAQPEIKYLAELMLQAVKTAKVAPIAISWLEKNGWEL